MTDASTKQAIEHLRSLVNAEAKGGGRRMAIPLTDEGERALVAQGFEWDDTREFMVREGAK